MESHETFRRYLQKELERKTKKNPQFSIRSYAKQLNIEHSSLTQILSGKRKLTFKMCQRLAATLHLSPLKFRVLTKKDLNGGTSKAWSGFNKLQDDAFRIISDWHYYAILELTRIKRFKADINWIATSLGLSTAETITSVERLKRLGYLKIQNGVWKDSLGSATNLGNEYSTSAFTKHQKQLLKKASEAIDEIPYQERVQSAMILSGSRERVVEAKKMILNFIEELDEFMKTGPTRDEVYTLSVSLFPISKNKIQTKFSKGVTHENSNSSQ